MIGKVSTRPGSKLDRTHACRICTVQDNNTLSLIGIISSVLSSAKDGSLPIIAIYLKKK